MTKTVSIFVARLIFAAVFLMAGAFKFMGMGADSEVYRRCRLPDPTRAGVAGGNFRGCAGRGVLDGRFLFLRCLPRRGLRRVPGFCLSWAVALEGNQAEFGFFVDHFTFVAGLLFAAVHGPGDKWVWRIPRS